MPERCAILQWFVSYPCSLETPAREHVYTYNSDLDALCVSGICRIFEIWWHLEIARSWCIAVNIPLPWLNLIGEGPWNNDDINKHMIKPLVYNGRTNTYRSQQQKMKNWKFHSTAHPQPVRTVQAKLENRKKSSFCSMKREDKIKIKFNKCQMRPLSWYFLCWTDWAWANTWLPLDVYLFISDGRISIPYIALHAVSALVEVKLPPEIIFGYRSIPAGQQYTLLSVMDVYFWYFTYRHLILEQ